MYWSFVAWVIDWRTKQDIYWMLIAHRYWLWRRGDASGTSPLHVTFEQPLQFKLQCKALNRLGYQHPSDKQPFDFTTVVWKLYTCMMMMSCTCFDPRHSPYSNYLCRTSDIAAVGTILTSLVMTRWPRFEPITFPTTILFSPKALKFQYG